MRVCNLCKISSWVLASGESKPVYSALACDRCLCMHGVRYVPSWSGLFRQWTSTIVCSALRRVLSSRRMRPAPVHARCVVLCLAKVI